MAEKENKNNELETKKKKIIFGTGLKGIVVFLAIAVVVLGITSASLFEMKVQRGIWNKNDDPDMSPMAYFSSIYVTDRGTLMAGMSVQEMWDKEELYQKYLPSVDALAYLLNAQVVTQYPYIDSANEEDLNGTIRFYRNGSTKEMKYVKNEILNQYISGYNGGNRSALDQALSSFTLNTDGSIRIAYLTEESQTVTTPDKTAAIEAESRIGASSSSGSGQYVVSKSKSTLQTTNIAYANLINKYILPFNLLWAISVYNEGDGENFAHVLATMAYESEIKLNIYDNKKTVIDTYDYTYDIENQHRYNNVSTSGIIMCTDNLDEIYEHVVSSQSIDKEFVTDPETVMQITSGNPTRYVETHTTYTPVLVVSNVNSWIAKYKSLGTFEKTDITENLTSTITPPASPTEWGLIGNNNISWSTTAGNWSSCRFSEIHETANSRVSNEAQTLRNSGQYRLVRIRNIAASANEKIYQRYNNIKETFKEETIEDKFNNTTLSTHTFNKDLSRILNVGVFLDLKTYLTRSFKTDTGYFRRIIQGNEDTANIVDLIAYWFNDATGTTDFGKDLKFDSIWGELYGDMNMVGLVTTDLNGGDFSVYTLDTNSFAIKDNETLKTAINSVYSGKQRENLLQVCNDGTFMELQNKYHVDAAFAIAITQKESSCGTNWAAIDSSTYNWMSMTGSYNGKSYKNPNSKNPRKWRVYSSFSEATLDFGNIIANGSYYFKQGKYTVKEIGKTYCPDGTDSWANGVLSSMKKIYEAAGVNTSVGQGQTTSASGEGYDTIFEFGDKKYKEYKQSRGSYKDNRYSEGTISSSGCGPTSAAIVASAYGSSLNPGTLVATAKDRYSVSNFVASPSSTGKMLTSAGLNYTSTYSLSKSQLQLHLKSGKPAVLNVDSKCGAIFTSNTHYIAVLGINGDKVYVSHPNPRRTTGWVDIDKVITCNQSSSRVAFLIQD